MTYDLGWVDIAFAAVMCLSIIVGMVRGFVFEVLSLVGWLVAYIVAQVFVADVAARLPLGAPGSALNAGAAFALIFLVVLVVWSLLVRLVRMLVHATPLSVIDRLLGGVFGVFRGVLLVLVVATVVAITPGAKSPQWRGSYAAGWAHVALKELEPWMPEAISRHLSSRRISL